MKRGRSLSSNGEMQQPVYHLRRAEEQPDSQKSGFSVAFSGRLFGDL